MTRKEITQGIANRFVHSRTYIFFYLVMAGLSITTVVLSLKEGCPGLAFYILEIIINTAMILEVGIRFVAFGQVRPPPEKNHEFCFSDLTRVVHSVSGVLHIISSISS